MLNGRYQPIVSQAEITGKGHPDLFSFRERARGEGPYPGGTVDQNLWIVPGELLLCRRNARNTFGKTSQLAFSSANGLRVDPNNPEAAMRELCFVGFAKAEYEYGGENLFGTDPLDHGFAFLYSGSITTVNTGSQDLFAFDTLCWRLPPTAGGDPRSQNSGGPRVMDTGLNALSNNTRRIGVPQGKALFQIERFDPCDFSFQVAGCFQLFDKPKAVGGVKNLQFSDFFNKNTRDLTPLQEEAFAYSRGLLMVAAMGSANPQQTAESYGLFDPNGLSADGIRKLGQIFGRNVFPGSNNGNIPQDVPERLSGNVANDFNYVKDHIFDLLLGGLAGSIEAKKSRIVGTAISSAKINQSIDIMARTH